MSALYTYLSKTSFTTMVALSAWAAMGVPFALADELGAIKDLQLAGKIPEALAKVNQELATKPKDAQLRFMKGVILVDSGRTAEAIAVFQRLTEDYPKLPEPHNNLAVLYASTGQFDKAKLALEAAIRTNPSYATAHENLGDVYARMAADAYGKALQLDVSKTQVQPKLAMIRDLVGTPVTGVVKPAVIVGATPITPTTGLAPNKPASVAVPLPAAVAPPPPAVAPGKATMPAPLASNPPKVLETQKAPEGTKATAGDQKQVESAVLAWASAWSSRDVSAYLSSYTPEFTPVSGGARKAWEEDRKVKILGKSKISVKISMLATSIDGSSAVARFRQDYSADALQTSTRKTLHFVKRGNRWLISKEISG